MLIRRQSLTGFLGGAFSLAAIGAFVGVAILSLLRYGGSGGLAVLFSDRLLLSVLRFTLLQAALSTVLSVMLAIPVARSLARQTRFPGRLWLVRLMAVPMGLPVLIGALGLIGIWGRQGLVNDGLLFLGKAEPVSIYGLGGILLAHVFFNLPLAARLMLAGLERLPSEYWLMSATLGMKPRAVFRFIEWPALRPLIPGIAGLVFMLCATSFTLVLILGGGPAATTLEVAIYQALRFDFDPERAVSLAFLQIAVTALVLVAMALFPAPEEHGQTLGRPPRRFDSASLTARLSDGAVLTAAMLFLGLPLGSVVLSGLKADLLRLLSEEAFLRAAVTSMAIALGSALTALALALATIHAQTVIGLLRRPAPVMNGVSVLLAGVSSLVLLVPTIVLATGWFMALRSMGDIASFAPAVVVGINALMALPFVMRVVKPALANHRAATERLVLSLGIGGFSKLWLVDWPPLKKPLLTALSFAMALSLGDLGAVALFGSEKVTTLPWLIYSRMGHYRTNDADGLALVLGLICLLLTLAGTTGKPPRKDDVENAGRI
ncbi:thiamine transport system permease protein [Ciceribacter lividus]|uniref:Thiamine transport system permease protein ThiP n=1 Tax=Ciceribacter lividus TaxID=1197950 RepID=A0A6I7HQ20_9HYPH|nr:thiamine/thiamine pyrophosphate ABC transporter permease ThiP [Ciceribacter lividus]RCW25798.1 thiamine transport system permease protein [Ciceribacter lividus]